MRRSTTPMAPPQCGKGHDDRGGVAARYPSGGADATAKARGHCASCGGRDRDASRRPSYWMRTKRFGTRATHASPQESARGSEIVHS